ncbi:MAG: hypothetical protein JWR08_310 [Enterovirga sp.]|nr:hypothetical protein [Enterovirga sp.]
MATSSNRFHQVDTPDPGAVTVAIRNSSGGIFGEVLGPGAETRLTLGADGSMTPLQALAVGCHLANQLDRAVVVIDEGGHWQSAWGRLDRP